MWDFLRRLFDSDFMPHGHCWHWEPWVVWSNVLSDCVIATSYTIIGFALIHLRLRRNDATIDRILELFGVFIFACGCTHAMEVFNTWNSAFRFAGLLKAFTASVSLVSMLVLLRLTPQLVSAPSLTRALAMDAALSSETREKRRMEGQLRQSQDRFRILVEGIKDYAIVLLDPEGLITSWNPGAERLKGYNSREILGQNFGRLFTREDQADGRPEQVLQQAAHQDRIELDVWMRRKDGSCFLANAIIAPFRDGQGELQGFTSVTRDITEQRATQAALQNLAENLEDKVKAQVRELHQSEARLQGFMRHASAAIAFKGLDGCFLFVNPRMENLLGRPSADILGKTSEDLFPPEAYAQILARERRVLGLKEDTQAEEPWPVPDGSVRHCLVHEFPLVDAMNQCWGLGLIATDITERKQADLALLQSQKLESLGVLTGGIAHDFNNLLGAMQGNVELAMMEPSMPLARPYLDTLRNLLAKAENLIRQMLAYSGRGTFNVAVLDLNRLVQEMTKLLDTSISKKATMRLELNDQPLPMAIDPSQLQQVVMNLVINASESLEDRTGTIVIRTRMERHTEETLDRNFEGQGLKPGLYVSLEIIDNGIGMTPEVMKRIFDPFFTTKFTGRGLGLAAIHGIIRGHQAGIRVESQVNRGSSFKLLFPAAPGPLQSEASPPPLLQAPAKTIRAGSTILVVEDEADMRNVVVRGLERAGFPTLEARDGLEALAVLKQHQAQIRLILMDLTMPNLDGEETYRELRRRGINAPVILSSGFSEADALHRFKGLDLAGFVQKPYALGNLIEIVRNHLEPAR